MSFRVTDGYGSFNWRIIIDFDYNPWEKKVYMYEKKRMFKSDFVVVVLIMDNAPFRSSFA